MSDTTETADSFPTLEVDLEKVRRSRRGGSVAGAMLYPALAVAAALALWYAAIVLFSVPPYVLPPPHDVGASRK